MKKQVITSAVVALTIKGLLQNCALAQEPAPEPFEAEAELGLLDTSGNTNSTALKAELKIKQELSSWRNRYVLEALYNEDQLVVIEDGVEREQSQVTAEKYFASAQADYKLDDQHRGLFVFGSYEEDKFSGYAFQASLAAGISGRLIDYPNSHLDYSIGPGVSINRTEEVRSDAGVLLDDNVYEESAMVRLAAQYRYDFSDHAKFTQTFASDAAIESGANTKSKAESAVTATINSSFAMKASVTFTHNTEAPEDRVSTDRQSAITLVYTF